MVNFVSILLYKNVINKNKIDKGYAKISYKMNQRERERERERDRQTETETETETERVRERERERELDRRMRTCT